MRHSILWVALIFVSSWLVTSQAAADILLPGHKNVRHELVFNDSPLFENNRLVAAPTAGFSGVHEVKPGEPFRFSSKYRTTFYVVPEDYSLEEFDRDEFARFPNCKPPRNEIRSVPATNPLTTALTTLEFASVDGSSLIVNEVRHQEFGKSGTPVQANQNFLWFGLIIAAGLALCLLAIRRLRKTSRAVRPDSLPAD